MGENTRTSHQKQQGEFTAKGKDFLAGDRTHDLPFSGQGAHRWATEVRLGVGAMSLLALLTWGGDWIWMVASSDDMCLTPL